MLEKQHKKINNFAIYRYFENFLTGVINSTVIQSGK